MSVRDFLRRLSDSPAVDTAVAASRPRGISDAMAVQLATQIVRNDALEARVAQQDAEIAQLTDAIGGYEQANLEMFRKFTTANQDLIITRCERDAAERKLAER
jgi:hypothetical protein